jgi:hypothetical protein
VRENPLTVFFGSRLPTAVSAAAIISATAESAGARAPAIALLAIDRAAPIEQGALRLKEITESDSEGIGGVVGLGNLF